MSQCLLDTSVASFSSAVLIVFSALAPTLCFQNDTQMVSILYRTHKGLSSTGKTSSLYAFDALARAARHHANKNHAVADVNSGQGNSATFLLKMEGILDGLFQDMVTNGTNDLKVSMKCPILTESSYTHILSWPVRPTGCLYPSKLHLCVTGNRRKPAMCLLSKIASTGKCPT